jgi:hypothetical protein
MVSTAGHFDQPYFFYSPCYTVTPQKHAVTFTGTREQQSFKICSEEKAGGIYFSFIHFFACTVGSSNRSSMPE